MHTIALMVVALVVAAFARGSAPATGDTKLSGLDTTHPVGWTEAQFETFDSAMSIVEAYSPSMASDISDAVGSGAVGLAEINNPQPAPPEGQTLGASDSNTLGLELDRRTPEDVAGTIIHEWTHHEGFGQEPPEESGPCAEARAYAAQSDALSSISCEAETPPTYKEVTRVGDRYDQSAAACEASGGTPAEPQATVACGCK